MFPTGSGAQIDTGDEDETEIDADPTMMDGDATVHTLGENGRLQTFLEVSSVATARLLHTLGENGRLQSL